MSEQDYQRGLRGGNCINYDGQHYTDWYAGYQEYERQRKEKEFREELEMDKFYSPEEQTERYKRRQAEREREIAEIQRNYENSKAKDKERAYKNADKEKSSGIWVTVIVFFVILIVGYIVKWFFNLFSVNIPSVVIWGLDILIAIFGISESNRVYKKDLEEAKRRYGLRD